MKKSNILFVLQTVVRYTLLSPVNHQFHCPFYWKIWHPIYVSLKKTQTRIQGFKIVDLTLASFCSVFLIGSSLSRIVVLFLLKQLPQEIQRKQVFIRTFKEKEYYFIQREEKVKVKVKVKVRVKFKVKVRFKVRKKVKVNVKNKVKNKAKEKVKVNFGKKIKFLFKYDLKTQLITSQWITI